jgi:hypothetical protein
MSVQLLRLVILLGLAFPLRASDTTPSYSQSYTIIIKGVQVGSESVKESADKEGNRVSSSAHEILVTDGLETKRMAFETEMVLEKGSSTPSRYLCRYTSGASRDWYEVKIKGNRITRVLNRGGHAGEVSASWTPDTVLVDFSVYHHYDYLVRRYDSKKGGRQEFKNFIPVIGTEIPLLLTRLADSTLEIGDAGVPVRNFRVDFTNIFSATLSVDKAGRLVRLTVPEQDLLVVRTDLVPK